MLFGQTQKAHLLELSRRSDNGMMYAFTQIPNVVLDGLLPFLTVAELKVLLVVIRQTLGWRKKRDWISQKQLCAKTGLSRQSVSLAVSFLATQELIQVTDVQGQLLSTPALRKGRSRLYYSLGTEEAVRKFTMRCKLNRTRPVRKPVQDKRNSTKEPSTRSVKSIGDILQTLYGRSSL